MGLPPDAIFAALGADGEISIKAHASNAGYRLRPETIESIFYLSRMAATAEARAAWREVGWGIFEAIGPCQPDRPPDRSII